MVLRSSLLLDGATVDERQQRLAGRKTCHNTGKAGRSIFKIHTGVQAGRHSTWGSTVENEPLGNDNNREYALHTRSDAGFCNRDHRDHNRRDGLQEVVILFGSIKTAAKNWNGGYGSFSPMRQPLRVFLVVWLCTGMPAPTIISPLRCSTPIGNPRQNIINTEACVDAEVPSGKMNWYWSNRGRLGLGRRRLIKYLHPEICAGISPRERHHRLPEQLCGWNGSTGIWCLDKQGGPNWFGNWCTAPVII